MGQAEKKQRIPVRKYPGDRVAEFVIADILKREEVGKEKYGEPLTTVNGRSAVLDLYQELLDGVLYTKQLLLEIEWVFKEVLPYIYALRSVYMLDKENHGDDVERLNKIIFVMESYLE